ncbi:MAG: ABC transporter substrate-binding protein [Methanothrix sp.]|nr:MAG: ABC transporter substrate-binding protein [Methanothrix sp.]
MNYRLPLILLLLALLILGLGAGKSESNTLVVGEMFDITTNDLDPVEDGSVLAEKALVTEELVGVNPDLSLKPSLAESWTQKNDKTWEIKLRDDVYFHDGSKLTANDVKLSLERANKQNSKVASLLKMQSIEVVDPTTLVIKTSEVNPILPAVLHYPSTAIISQKSLNDKGELVTPIGTGPFKIDGFDPQTHILTVAKNDKWWGGEVKLEKIILKPIQDPNTRALALQSEDVDFTVDVPYNEVESIGKMDGINVQTFQNPRIYYLSFNFKHAPLDDAKVRQAIAYGIDKEAIVKYVLFGVGKSAIGPFMPSFNWANQSLVAYELNVPKAKSLLEEAGWKDTDGDGIVDKDGKPLEISLYTWPQRPGQPPMAESIAGQLKDIGIKVKVDVIDYTVIDERRSKGDWDVVLGAMNVAMVPDPSYILEMNFKTGGAWNYGYSNSQVDKLLQEAATSTDQKERFDKFNKVQGIVQNELPIITVAYYGLAIAKRDYVKGYEFDPTAHDYRLSPEMYIEN